MSTPGYDVDLARVDGIAAALDAAADPLTAAGDGATDVPQAGPVTGEVISYVGALARAVSGLVEGTAGTAGAARSAAVAYRDTDRRAAAALDAAVPGS
ncbi:hypothetical protein [Actinomycetospora termitidis]|uniref:Excreted virulence factor EspC, type VII ESX diderm n=1 Tax=Actinomycetospora termitidis TaxID=3053470 RepID=A0ABT7MIN2_9PSEU|nr:hypothetical protein [Actinomycetospora sp. Odt1-22]MDL5159822.1 hypothetical protein [Actinomycetospora sp. Odt1-22]